MSAKADVRVDAAGNISVTPDPLPAGKGRNIPIKWDIVDSPGWTFTSNGIDIKNNGGQFSGGHASPQGTTYHWVDKNDNDVLYKYDINVTKGGVTKTKDPAIQNQSS